MTKFNIQTADLKYIMSALHPALPKTDCKPVHLYIKFECADGNLSAYATDGYRIHSVAVHVDIIEGESNFSFLMKPITVPRTESDFIPCELSEKEIMFNFGEMKIAYKLGENVESFLDVHAAIPKDPVTFRIAFSPKFLADAAKSLKCDDRTPAILELRTPMMPAVLYNEKDKSDYRVVLPVRMRASEGWGTAFPERNQNES